MEQNMEKYAGYNQGNSNGQYSGMNAGASYENGSNPLPNVNNNMDQNSMDILLKKLKKEMLINRIISCVTLVMTTVILVLVIIAFVELNNFLTMVEPVVEELSKIDMEALNESLNNFNNIIETFNVDELMDTINSIDFEGINEVLNGLDVEELTETLENINEGADRLDEISEWFENSPLNIFGIGSQ